MPTNTLLDQNTPPALRRPTVFIAEDSVLVRDRLIEMLEDTVSVVGHAATPADAVSGILENDPDTVVLDIHLLGGTGLEVLRAVHPVKPQTVFVVLTNHANPQYRQAFMKAGASCVLDKSSEFDKVKETLLACPLHDQTH